jgi:hypothetical protein
MPENVIFLDDHIKKIKDADLQYYLLPARNPPPEYSKLHDQAFDFWLSVWKPVLAGLGYSDAMLHDDFIRQDVISCICAKGQVVAVYLHSFFSLETKAVNTFRYIKKNYPEFFFQKMKDMGISRVVAAQYLAIHPDWRGKANPPVPLASVIIGLANFMRDDFGLQACIGPARRDHKVTDIFYAHGGDCIVANFENHNVACDVIANIQGRTHAHTSPEIRAAEEILWKNRIDITTVVKSNSSFNSKLVS